MSICRRQQRQPLDAIIEAELARHRAEGSVVDTPRADDRQARALPHVSHGAQQPGEAFLLGELPDEQQQVGLA